MSQALNMFKSDGFITDLVELINVYSIDDYTNTPDYLLASYLVRCVETIRGFNESRDAWFGYDKETK